MQLHLIDSSPDHDLLSAFLSKLTIKGKSLHWQDPGHDKEKPSRKGDQLYHSVVTYLLFLPRWCLRLVFCVYYIYTTTKHKFKKIFRN